MSHLSVAGRRPRIPVVCPVLQSALMLVFPVAMAFAAATDLLTFKIPNRISIALVAAFLIAAPFSGLTWPGFFGHLATFAVVLALGIALFAAGLFGGGDAKLLAAAALWVGYESLPLYMAMVAICGAVLAIVLIGFRRVELPPSVLQREWIARLHDRKAGMPYGIALAAAALWVYPSTRLFSNLLA
jgi:prepilin peptidase CpaA